MKESGIFFQNTLDKARLLCYALLEDRGAGAMSSRRLRLDEADGERRSRPRCATRVPKRAPGSGDNTPGTVTFGGALSSVKPFWGRFCI